MLLVEVAMEAGLKIRSDNNLQHHTQGKKLPRLSYTSKRGHTLLEASLRRSEHTQTAQCGQPSSRKEKMIAAKGLINV